MVENTKILISACLLGRRVRYDGKTLAVSSQILQQWLKADRVVTICPEADAGMGVPRLPAEITGGDGFDVLSGYANVVNEVGLDVTDKFILGANLALSLCQQHDISVAVLSESSPSCGSTYLDAGNFDGEIISGRGVLSQMFIDAGIEVFSHTNISDAAKYLSQHNIN